MKIVRKSERERARERGERDSKMLLDDAFPWDGPTKVSPYLHIGNLLPGSARHVCGAKREPAPWLLLDTWYLYLSYPCFAVFAGFLYVLMTSVLSL